MLKQNDTVRYRLHDTGEFTIEDYNASKLFASFLPGVAGKTGAPMWLFYVNRGQCVCSMGVEGKHNPIMEFLPANQAYNLVSSQGFRTFIKLMNDDGFVYYEPFQKGYYTREMDISQRMNISPASLTLEEENRTLGLRFTVDYFNVPQDTYAGLVRRLRIQNTGDKPVRIEALDGLPLIIPYGIDNFGLKNIRRLVEAFVEVANFDKRAPFFKGKVEPADRPDVVRIEKGNFYVGYTVENGEVRIASPIVDPVRIFGARGDYRYPDAFLSSSSADLVDGQILENRLPSAMGVINTTIEPGATFVYNSVIGHAVSVRELNALVPRITSQQYADAKSTQNRDIVGELTQHSFICSREAALDHYTRQNFLDNALRGGFPYTLRGKNASTVLYLYSRKHGDLERDYNDYRLTPTPYSQGNGNYRDVNQNRRCDLLFNPDVRDENIEHFYNLIQLDGFNPLVIREIRFAAPENGAVDEVLEAYFSAGHAHIVREFLREPFTPGDLIVLIRQNNIPLPDDLDAFLGDLLGVCSKRHDAEFGEGYWIDHWTYNLDLIENYLAIIPEKKRELLFDKRTFTYFESAHHVVPRDDKYVVWNGATMQFNSVVHDAQQEQRIADRKHDNDLVRKDYGEGEIYRTTLFGKMLCLMVNKLASLDPAGVGVEMESDKPDWYDALNGLPGLIGSSLNETLEVKRHLLFMREAVESLAGDDEGFSLHEELVEFLAALVELLAGELDPFVYWDRSATLKETYRSKTWRGVGGAEKPVTRTQVLRLLTLGLDKIEAGVAQAWNNDQQVISTYFINHVTDYELIEQTDAKGVQIVKRNARGLPCFRAKAFRQKALPLFLEGPVHFLRSGVERDVAERLVRNIRNSGLYDAELQMYKVNEPLDGEPMEIGRARTFSPGWFENESIWLHMEYKYMLEMLRNGLHEQFFEDFRKVCVPFMKPEVYGRSTLENSSFIVSSSNPDPSLHGNGFVARLSGATAEFINMLAFMTIGQRPFRLDDELTFALEPVIPAWLFTTAPVSRSLLLEGQRREVEFPAHSFSFMFLGGVLVIYHNPKQQNTYGQNAVQPASYKITDGDGVVTVVEGPVVCGELARKIRNREVKRIDVQLQ